jgi:hypothetical protein
MKLIVFGGTSASTWIAPTWASRSPRAPKIATRYVNRAHVGVDADVGIRDRHAASFT